jgi:LVIVD repeat
MAYGGRSSVARNLSWIVLAIALLSVAQLAPASAPDKVYPGPTPEARCGPGSKPETGMQGRVSRKEIKSGRAKKGYTCNTKKIAHFGVKGGYKVERFVDNERRECAYYDSTLLFPKDAVAAGQERTGVYVLDMSNPAKPVKTETLVTPAMQSPHESMVLNKRRGLLVAVTANPIFYPGVVDIYDVNEDCRHPVLKASHPVGGLGHESGFAPDGKTFYVASLDGDIVTAVDVSNPSAPVPFWSGRYRSHGLSVSDDGKRVYLAAREGLIILDVSEIQNRTPNPQVTEVSRLTWPTMSTPQITIPVTIKGHPYVIEVDEFSRDDWATGAARIIDIANEKKPKVISNIKLEVNMTKTREKVKNDPGAGESFEDGLQGYAAHYCEVPKRHEPKALACSFILSGLRLFDIRDPFHPKEIAYFNGPAVPTPENAGGGTGNGANYAMSKPVLVPERAELWYTDGHKGFYVVRVTNGVWPFKRR